MNRDLLLRSLPTQQALIEASAPKRKQMVENGLSFVLDAIHDDHGQPTAWEAIHLWAAIGAACNSQYFFATICLANTIADQACYGNGGQWQIPPPDADAMLHLKSAFGLLTYAAAAEQ